MTDLAFRFEPPGADFELEGGDLALDEGLVSPVLVSLFSDGLAREDDPIPDGTEDRRGWWAEDRGAGWGSRLWVFDRGKTGTATSAAVREAARDSLRWLETAGIASEVAVSSSVNGRHEIDLAIAISRGTSPTWSRLWEGVEATDFDLPGASLKLLTY